MARIRTVKPEFWTSASVGRLSRDARLLLLGLFNEADDEGRLLGSAKRLTGCLFPYDDDVTPRRFERWLSELEAEEHVVPYEVDGVRYLVLPGFLKHQKISHPTRSKLPIPSGELSELLYREGNREQGTGTRADARAAVADEFAIVWQDYPRKIARKAALTAYQARRRDGIAADELAKATTNYAAAMTAEGRDETKILHGATFFGSNERWKDYLEPVAPPKPKPPKDEPRSLVACVRCGKRGADCVCWREAQ